MLAVAIVVVLLLVVLNGLFAMTELAVVSSRKSKLQSRAEKGDRGARAALKLAEEPTHFLSAVQVGITLIGILAGAYGQAAIAGELNRMIEAAFPAVASWSEIASTAVVVVFITYISLIVGELVPKRLALIFPESIAAKMAAPISTLAIVLHPFVVLLTASTSGILKIMGVKDRDGSDVTQEEVETMIAEGTSAGLIEPEEQEMIEEILTLGDRPIRVAMTPRHEVFWVALDDTEAQLREEVRTCPYSRIVVARENDVDNPLGVVHKKDLLDSLLDNGEFNIEKHVQLPAFIPQSTSVLKALEIMKSSKVHMAFLVDEFGAFEGVVTATDLLEMIAGDFDEGHDEADAMIRQRDDGTWLVDGQTDLEELSDELGEDFGEAEGFHTVAGLVLHQLSRVPAEGEILQLGRFEVEVIDMDDRRIDKLLFRQVVKPEDEARAVAEHQE
ncbi:MAG: hemolysin family protein [Alphaproteobacteria bacterium]|nr:hemolysin family protein [Alphaproteobacteria bacterium]MBU1525277.1 hemolysin family protein [Alphaproteobacteria bacterium]MBU2118326.1 hemolysin family protein [Alphaproteobacteria bacterium]MBU2351221.1 hemolysin family protein [Alphaproteobacteria bacterium]MBU2383528.1 hemolysin family protein [Alphaproteobacteria bacterium]